MTGKADMRKSAMKGISGPSAPYFFFGYFYSAVRPVAGEV